MTETPTSDFMIQCITQNMLDAFSHAIKKSPAADASIEKIDGSVWTYSGTDMLLFNSVFTDKNALENPEKHFTNVVNFFAAKPFPYVWWWMQQSAIPETIQQQLSTHHFNPLGIFWGVAAALNNFVPTAHSKTVDVREVTTESEYREFVEIVGTVFHFSEEGKRDFAIMFASFGPKGTFRHYLGYKNGKPVATVTGYIANGVAGIYNAATLPDAQKTGLCSALMQRVMQEGKAQGCQTSVAQLMAPGMAKGLMEKIGFATYCEWLPFMSGKA